MHHNYPLCSNRPTKLHQSSRTIWKNLYNVIFLPRPGRPSSFSKGCILGLVFCLSPWVDSSPGLFLLAASPVYRSPSCCQLCNHPALYIYIYILYQSNQFGHIFTFDWYCVYVCFYLCSVCRLHTYRTTGMWHTNVPLVQEVDGRQSTFWNGIFCGNEKSVECARRGLWPLADISPRFMSSWDVICLTPHCFDQWPGFLSERLRNGTK